MKQMLAIVLLGSLCACSTAGTPPGHELVRCPSGGDIVVVADDLTNADLETLLWHFIRCVDCGGDDRDDQGRWTGNLLFFREADLVHASCESRDAALTGRGWERYVGHVAAEYSFWGASLTAGQRAAIGHPDREGHIIIAEFGEVVDPDR